MGLFISQKRKRSVPRMELKNTASRKKAMRRGYPLTRMWLAPRGLRNENTRKMRGKFYSEKNF